MVQAETQATLRRVAMALVGAVAGLAAWYFSEVAEAFVDRPRMFLLLVTFVMGGFGILLGLIGPLPWPRAAAGALGHSGVVALLVVWASARFDRVQGFFESGLPLAAMALLYLIGTPFVSAGLRRRGGITDYALLFDTAWGLLVRYLAAWLFTAVVWGIVFLSDALLDIVGVTVISDVLEVAPVPFALTGLFLGLAMAIMHELRDFISPFLVLQLFRVVLPVLVAVVAVFLLALPVRGFDRLFGTFSVAGTLMAVALAAITLVTSALDREETQAARAGVVRLSARIMCLILPALTAAAAWAVWLRVAQYGWTPERLAAALSAGLLLVYALAYAGSALRSDWATRVRRVNLVMALVVTGLAALWLSPAIHAEAISTRSQVARFVAGAEVGKLPLWEMQHQWGRAGVVGLRQMLRLAEADDARAEALGAALDWIGPAAMPSRAQGALEAPPDLAMIGALLGQIAVFPQGRAVSAAELATLPHFILDEMQLSCARGGDTGPGCAIFLADLNPHRPGEEGLLLQRTDAQGGLILYGVTRHDGALVLGRRALEDVTGRGLQDRWAALIAALERGEIDTRPSGIDMITIGGIGLIP